MDFVLCQGDRNDCARRQQALRRLAIEGRLKAYLHVEFWQCLGTYRKQQMLERMWDGGNAAGEKW